MKLPVVFKKIAGVVGIFTTAACGNVRNVASICKNRQHSTPQIQNLTAGSQSAEQLSGVGYIDIETTSSSGQKMSRRCSMKVQPETDNNSRVHVFTAVHCLFAVKSEEFKNSKYTLQVFHNGGYFPMSVNFDGILQLNRLAQSFESYLALLPAEQYRWNFTMSENSINFCVNKTKEYELHLGGSKKNIACFGKNELRVLSGTITPKPQHSKIVEKIFNSQRSHFAMVDSQLTAQERYMLKLRTKNALLQNVIPFYLEQIGFWLSEKNCTTAPAQLPVGPNGLAETQALCPFRDQIINDLRSRFPEEFKVISPILEKPVADLDELKALHSSIFSCNIRSEADLDRYVGEIKTACDHENLSRYFWRRWVSGGTSPTSVINNPLWGLFGLNNESYFGLSYNQKVETSLAPKAAVAALTSSIGSLSPASFNPEVIMLNFENGKSEINLVKTDSGSILSVFGFLPVGTLSTLDGEATSGGASVTPLPEVPPEDDSNVVVSCK